jgi:spermidine synthase
MFLISAATLLLELTLTRIFDVVLWTNLSNFIVSSAIFGLGLGGIAVLWRPGLARAAKAIVGVAVAYAFSVVLLIPAIALLPFDFTAALIHPALQALWFAALYVFLVAPFFAAGVVIAAILTRYAHLVHYLYFWDLLGAGIGSLGIIWLPTLIGPAAILVLIAASGCVVAALLAPAAGILRRFSLIAAGAVALLWVTPAGRVDFQSHVVKGTPLPGEEGKPSEYTRWDPAAKIDVVSLKAPFLRHILYDGGSQQSYFFRFDGALDRVRQHYFDVVDGRPRYNLGRYVALAHWLKRDSSARTLVIGSAGGQEVLAALTFGAAQVDAVEMVCAVIEAAQGPYADFTGNLYRHPKVNAVCDEGRNFLRHTSQRYDVIQMHSNHTSSSVAQGAGAVDPIYLQTVEAYRDYLSHLTDDGILQINYYVYPRMLTTAAAAFHELFPDRDFRQHVVIEASGWSEVAMPTVLIKRSPWTEAEVAATRAFVAPEFAREPNRSYAVRYAPFGPEAANVPAALFRAPLDAAVASQVPYYLTPTTDSRPFFRDLRKHLRPIETDSAGFVPDSTAAFINASLVGFVPRDRIHLYLLGGLSIAMAALFLWFPLTWMRVNGLGGGKVLPTAVYFGSLGFAFIVIEVVLIPKFVVLIGLPIYAMATVLFTLLVGAGAGSYFSGWIWRRARRWAWAVFPGVAALVAVVVLSFPFACDVALGFGQPARIALCAGLLFPLGVALGMPFPLGVAALSRGAPRLVPWAWSINGFMTVVGSLVAAVSSMGIGFDLTLLAGGATYLVAMSAWPWLRS